MNIDGASLLFRPPAEGSNRVQQDNRSYSARVTSQSHDDALSAFASAMAARLSSVPGDTQEGQSAPKDPEVLVSALTDSLQWIDERFGREAFTAAAGKILAATQSEASEETLSNGLVQTLRIIENNWGTGAGDEAIAQFNGPLNDALNTFFENGRSEEFLAVTADGMAFDGQNLVAVKRDFARYVAGQVEGQNSDSIVERERTLLESMIEEMEKNGIPQTLQEELDLRAQKAEAAYGWTPPVTAQMLDLAV